MTPFNAFIAGIAATLVVLAVGGAIYVSRSDPTLYACVDGDPLPSEYQRDENGELPADSDFWFFAWYGGDSTNKERTRRCADLLVNQWVRILACSVIKEIDGEDGEDGEDGDPMLKRAWEADAARAERGAGSRPDATTFAMHLLPKWSYLLRGNSNQGDGWADMKAEDLLVIYDREGSEWTLGDLCFSEYGDSRLPRSSDY